MEHLKAWNTEYQSSTWKGPYSLHFLDRHFKKGRVLDAGCGSGRYTLPLRMRDVEVVGIDVSLNALRMASERSEVHSLDINLLASNICQMPFSDASFDAVLCYGVLQHLLSEERALAIGEFKRILKKEGLLFLEVLGKDDMRYGGRQVEPSTFLRKSGVIYHYFTNEELGDLLKEFSYQLFESRKEKRFNGKSYTRHMINVVAQKY